MSFLIDDDDGTFDARQLIEAEKIRRDPARFAAAIAALRRQSEEAARQADALSDSEESDLERGYTKLGGL